MATKQKIKTVDRAALKNGIYAAQFGEAGTVKVEAGQFFPDFASLNDVQKGIIINGLSQKLNDSHAGADTPAEALTWTNDTLKLLLEGKWTVRVPGEGGPRGGDFYKAVAEFKSITETEARDKIAAMVENLVSDEVSERSAFAQVKAAVLKKYPQVQEIINRMKSEKLANATTVEVSL